MSRKLRKVPPTPPCRRPVLEGLEERVTPDANQNFVNGLYQSILHRPADSGAALFVQGLDNGTVTRFRRGRLDLNLAGRLSGFDPERLRAIPEAAGRSFGPQHRDNFLQSGGNLTQLEEDLVAGSNEFFTVEGGGTNAGFVNALYMAALNRSATGDPGAQPFINGLNNGTLTTNQVASDVLESAEFNQNVVNQDYLLLLGRPATNDPGALGFEQKLASGATQQTVEAQFASSQEYFNNQQSPTVGTRCYRNRKA